MNKTLRYLWLIPIFILGLFMGGKWNLPLAAWLTPIFVIRFFRSSDKAGRDFLLLWVASAISTILSWSGATFMSKIHPAAEAGFFLLMAPLGLLPYVVDRLYFRRFGSSAWLTLVYPVAATAMDFFSSNGSPFGTFGAAAYNQRDFLPVMQIVAVTGLWGITFAASWTASLVNHFWETKPTRLSWTFAGLLALILTLSFGRILLPLQPKETAQVAGFSLPAGKLSELLSQLQAGNEAGFRQAVDELHAQELDQIRMMAQDGADIVVLQEGAGIGYSDQVEALTTQASILAQAEGIYIVLPVFDLGKSPVENKIHIIDPNGAIVLTHVKYGGNDFEGSLKGDGILQTVDTPFGKLSAVICWDADFPTVIKQAGQQHVDLLFVPSNDWLEVKDIHAGMASFRAVENGLVIFRQTGEGVSSVVDAYGHELNRVDRFEENASGFTGIQNIQVPLSTLNTLYPSVGDLLGNATLVGLAGLLIAFWLTRKKKSQPAI
ncbi:MAG: carbon-nitrogen hydrolase family protein [Chloroflexi bacterium]|nr:carbon-nitrogen hydrolase family protein [Chloroflexota bacterium]